LKPFTQCSRAGRDHPQVAFGHLRAKAAGAPSRCWVPSRPPRAVLTGGPPSCWSGQKTVARGLRGARRAVGRPPASGGRGTRHHRGMSSGGLLRIPRRDLRFPPIKIAPSAEEPRGFHRYLMRPRQRDDAALRTARPRGRGQEWLLFDAGRADPEDCMDCWSSWPPVARGGGHAGAATREREDGISLVRLHPARGEGRSLERTRGTDVRAWWVTASLPGRPGHRRQNLERSLRPGTPAVLATHEVHTPRCGSQPGQRPYRRLTRRAAPALAGR